MLSHITQLTLEVVKQCLVCQRSHTKDDVRLVRSSDLRALVYVQCRECLSSIVWLVVIQPFGGVISWSGMKTDLSLEELQRLGLEGGEEISEDQVLEVHELLLPSQEKGEFIGRLLNTKLN